ncbi:Alpha/Beta hydrolase protein [Lophiotrema nucula]|uniref:Alpha/Beta hydrolase protein n=1 Tax=Lophiotrema nucula TaxID=690887 RepID=A0A6A5YRG8_9PLEO|nr:Alpha/Beta hydrolase protein [Lophiotrema nucula]
MSLFQVFITFFTIACALAVPIDNDKRAAKGIDVTLLATFNLMEQYAGAAYCNNNYNSANDKLTCSANNCPLVQSATTNTVSEFESTKATDVTGFVANDDSNQLIILSFRGSTSLANWLTNFNIPAVATTICSGCTAHGGFWQSWVDARPDVLAAVKAASAAHPDYKIVSVGHSLGGAIATLAAADLRNSGYAVALYTFGAPRVASTKLSSYITAQAGGNYRITHWNDPVPRLPPIAMNFVHISPEYYINKPNAKAVAATDFRTYTGSVNLQGNGAWLATDIAAHLWYLGGIADCSVTSFLGLKERGVEEGDSEGVEVVAKF